MATNKTPPITIAKFLPLFSISPLFLPLATQNRYVVFPGRVMVVDLQNFEYAKLKYLSERLTYTVAMDM